MKRYVHKSPADWGFMHDALSSLTLSSACPLLRPSPLLRRFLCAKTNTHDVERGGENVSVPFVLFVLACGEGCAHVHTPIPTYTHLKLPFCWRELHVTHTSQHAEAHTHARASIHICVSAQKQTRVGICTWRGKMMLESFTSRCAMWCLAQKATARTTYSILRTGACVCVCVNVCVCLHVRVHVHRNVYMSMCIHFIPCQHTHTRT